jgi:hypothetical protein
MPDGHELAFRADKKIRVVDNLDCAIPHLGEVYRLWRKRANDVHNGYTFMVVNIRVNDRLKPIISI